jgi:short-subunit dehydrogenase
MSAYSRPVKDQVIWLSGASSGIGEALAYELGRKGAKLALTSRRAEVLDKIASDINAEGGFAKSFPGDVMNLEQLRAIVSDIQKTLGPIDTVVANAGTHIPSKLENFNSSEYLGLMDVNYGGMLRTIEAALAGMQERRRGLIVGVASMAGYRGFPEAAAYGASKAAMINFLESLRFHMKPFGISVSIINPGFVKTPLTDKNDFYMPFLISSERAAEIMCSAIEDQKFECTFPRPFNWILKLMRVLPDQVYQKLVESTWRK